MTPVQVRMGRAALGLTVEDLAGRADVPADVLARLEAGAAGDASALARLQGTFEASGVSLLDDDGVRFRADADAQQRGPEIVALEQLNSANDE